jgi:hypothetical protein
VPRHVARLVTRLVALLVIDFSISRRLIVDYFAYAACPGAQHVARLVTRLVEPLVVDNTSRRLVVDYFAYAVRPGASARRAAHHAARRTACR